MLNDYYNDMGGNMGMSYGLGNVKLKNQSWGHAGQTFGTQAYAAALPNGYRFAICIDESQLVSVWFPSILFTNILSNL